MSIQKYIAYLKTIETGSITKAAAQLANALRPKAAVPYHYGSVVGSEKDAREFIALLDPAIEGKLLPEE